VWIYGSLIKAVADSQACVTPKVRAGGKGRGGVLLFSICVCPAVCESLFHTHNSLTRTRSLTHSLLKP
jgi:hypothetical protein